MHKNLIVVALPQESQGLLEKADLDILYTGIGKVNATYQLTRELYQRKAHNKLPAAIINFGTAGSRIFQPQTLIVCHQFVQRDMDVAALGFEHGQTPFEEGSCIIEHPCLIHHLPKGICGSGDNFETNQPKINCDVIDMEAYALAKVCAQEKINFNSIKYISDGANDTSPNDWDNSLKHAAQAFINFIAEGRC